MKFNSPVKVTTDAAQGTKSIVLTAPNGFNFIAGQYITITIPSLSHLPTKEQFRDFSVASAPEDLPNLKIVFRDSNSAFKKSIISLPTGEMVEVDGPKGVFTLPATLDKPVTFVAGGVGVTPFMSIIRHLVARGADFKPTVYFFNRNRESAPFLAELESYSNNINLVPIFDQAKPEHFSNLNNNIVAGWWYIAGPPGMVLAVRQVIIGLGVQKTNIKTEEFTGYA